MIEAQRAARAGQAATGALVAFAIVQAFTGTAWLLFLAGIHLLSATLVLLLALASELACWVLVPVWIYRAMAAARRSAPSLKTSPRWAVGWLFVPLAGLWKPLETMGQIWQGSQSKRYVDSASNPSTMNYWWFVWLVHMACLLGAAASFSPNLINGFVLLAGISGITGAVAAVLLVVLIRRIGRFQAKAADVAAFD